MKYLFFLIFLSNIIYAEGIKQEESKLIQCNDTSVNFSIPGDQKMPDAQVITICECLSNHLKPESIAMFDQISQKIEIQSELELVNFIEDNNRVQKLCAKKIFQ
ncbi:MAG: hypothetical protein EBW93_05870 [Betaproteobacteria bacterium]|nr:hypothetical protein [Betaproteobacteria bacterium]